MREIIFSSDGAKALNVAVQTKLAPYLFLCCNYNPNPCFGMSDDGKFYPAVLNLYNFAFDSSCIIRMLYRFNPKIYTSNETYMNLKSSLAIIENLRNCIAHNNSEFNGRVEATAIDQYRRWIQDRIGKTEPDSPGDYSKLLDALKTVADQLYNALEEYIDVVSKHRDRRTIIQTWKNEIIRWYANSRVKQNIFLGELENYYLSRFQTRPTYSLKHSVACLVQEYYTKESQLNNLRLIASRAKGNSGIMKAIADRQQQINDDITETETQFNKPSPDCFLERLFMDLPQMLIETLDKDRCSMLPDVLLQKQISILFDEVALPNKHPI